MKGRSNSQWLGKLYFNRLTGAPLKPSPRKKEDLKSLSEGLRAEFCKRYRKETKEYDKEFMKKYD